MGALLRRAPIHQLILDRGVQSPPLLKAGRGGAWRPAVLLILSRFQRLPSGRNRYDGEYDCDIVLTVLYLTTVRTLLYGRTLALQRLHGHDEVRQRHSVGKTQI